MMPPPREPRLIIVKQSLQAGITAGVFGRLRRVRRKAGAVGHEVLALQRKGGATIEDARHLVAGERGRSV
jgi:hypothetical protein